PHTFEALIERGANPNIPDQDGNTVVHHTAASGYVYGLELCISHGGDARVTNNKGENAADSAAANDKYHCVDAAIKAGASLSDGSPDMSAWRRKRQNARQAHVKNNW
ncbi:MAG: ankyrin repeat domain-containing protein, partial [bacterium]